MGWAQSKIQYISVDIHKHHKRLTFSLGIPFRFQVFLQKDSAKVRSTKNVASRMGGCIDDIGNGVSF